MSYYSNYSNVSLNQRSKDTGQQVALTMQLLTIQAYKEVASFKVATQRQSLTDFP